MRAEKGRPTLPDGGAAHQLTTGTDAKTTVTDDTDRRRTLKLARRVAAHALSDRTLLTAELVAAAELLVEAGERR